MLAGSAPSGKAMPSHPLSLGHLLEGRIEQDPITDKLSLRTVDGSGKPVSVDLQALLTQFVGKDVRMTLIGLNDLQRLAELVEQGGEENPVVGVYPQNIPFNVPQK